MTQKRILCIDDEPEFIDLVKLILGRGGFEAKGAVGGKEGLQAMVQDPPDLVLLDLMMPDMDGWEVYRQIKANPALGAIPIVIFTAKAQSIDRVHALHIARADAYLTKPCSPIELIRTVERVLADKAEWE